MVQDTTQKPDMAGTDKPKALDSFEQEQADRRRLVRAELLRVGMEVEARSCEVCGATGWPVNWIGSVDSTLCRDCHNRITEKLLASTAWEGVVYLDALKVLWMGTANTLEDKETIEAAAGALAVRRLASDKAVRAEVVALLALAKEAFRGPQEPPR